MQFTFFLRILLANIPETGFEINLTFMSFETRKKMKLPAMQQFSLIVLRNRSINNPGCKSKAEGQNVFKDQ